jgi:hypothetical protein
MECLAFVEHAIMHKNFDQIYMDVRHLSDYFADMPAGGDQTLREMRDSGLLSLILDVFANSHFVSVSSVFLELLVNIICFDPTVVEEIIASNGIEKSIHLKLMLDKSCLPILAIFSANLFGITGEYIIAETDIFPYYLNLLDAPETRYFALIILMSILRSAHPVKGTQNEKFLEKITGISSSADDCQVIALWALYFWFKLSIWEEYPAYIPLHLITVLTRLIDSPNSIVCCISLFCLSYLWLIDGHEAGKKVSELIHKLKRRFPLECIMSLTSHEISEISCASLLLLSNYIFFDRANMIAFLFSKGMDHVKKVLQDGSAGSKREASILISSFIQTATDEELEEFVDEELLELMMDVVLVQDSEVINMFLCAIVDNSMRLPWILDVFAKNEVDRVFASLVGEEEVEYVDSIMSLIQTHREKICNGGIY